MAILIVTLLKIVQVKGHYDISFKILLVFHKIIISISIVHAGHGIIQGKLLQLLCPSTFFSRATVCLADSIPSTTIKIKKEILPKTPTSLPVL